MVDLISAANITVAGNWNLFSTGGKQLTRSSNTQSTTSDVASPNFTIPNGELVDGVLLHCRAINATGTITIRLRESTTNKVSVTINASDLPTSNVGWVFFKFTSIYTSTGLATVNITVQGSSAGNALFFRSATTADWAKLVRRTTTATASVGDNLYVSGEFTGAGALTSYVVTMGTAATQWGTMDLCNGGSFKNGSASSTTYQHKFQGNFEMWNGSSLDIGNSVALASSSTCTLWLNGATDGDFLFRHNDGASVTLIGASKTQSQLLAANMAAAATSGTLNGTPTNWNNGDTIAIASTTRTNTECESVALSANVTTTAFSCGAVANAHGGSGSVVAEVINITRNVVIRGGSTTIGTEWRYSGATNSTFTNVEIYYLTNAGMGLTGASSGCTLSITGCSFHEHTGASEITSYSMLSVNGQPFVFTITGNVFWKMAKAKAINMTAPAVTTTTMSGNILMFSTATANELFTCNCTTANSSDYSNTRIIGGGFSGIDLQFNTNGSFGITTGLDGLIAHSCASSGLTCTGANALRSATSASIASASFWRNGAFGVDFNLSRGLDSFTFTSCTFFGNATAGMGQSIASAVTRLTCTSCTFDAGTTLTQPIGVRFGHTTNATMYEWIFCKFFQCSFGATNGHSTSDINVAAPATGGTFCDNVGFEDCIFGSSSPMSGNANLVGDSSIYSMHHNQVDGTNFVWLRGGTIQEDTTRYATASPSTKYTPISASVKLATPAGHGKLKKVANGAMATFTVKVRKSNTVTADGFANDASTYNGAQPRLIVRKQIAGGISADTVLDTATNSANGAFLTLSGTTAAVTDDTVLEACIDCDGTVGNLWVDDWS